MSDSAMRPPGGVAYLQNLQIMRCLAAVMVLFSHLERETASGRPPGITAILDPTGIAWASGVDIFFVVSGFIMYHLTADRFGSGAYAGEFLKRRFIRIAPLYWIFTTLMILATLLARGQVHHADATWDRSLLSYLFFPAMRADGLAMPVLAIGWTLNLEVMFYLAYAAALLAPRRIGLGCLTVGFLLLAGFGGRLAGPLPPLAFWSQPIILEFLLGIALAYAFRRGLRLGRGRQVAILILSVAVMALLDRWAWGQASPMPPDAQPPDWSRWLWGGVPALLAGAALMLGPEIGGPWGRVLARGGDASYALYLSHPFTLNILSLAWGRLRLPTAGWAYVGVGMTACILVAVAVHRLVEAPILSVLRRRFEPLRAVTPA